MLRLLILEQNEAIDPDEFLSKGKNTPFAGWACQGMANINFCRWENRLGKRKCTA